MRFLNSPDWSWRYGVMYPALARLPWSLAYGSLNWAARFSAWRQPEKKAALMREMSAAFPEAGEEQLAHWVHDHFMMVEQDILDTWFLESPRLQRKVRLQGFEQVQQARAEGRRVILTGGHFSRFWLAGPAMRRLGHSTGTVTRDGDEGNHYGLHPAEHRYRLFKLERLSKVLGGPFWVEGEDLRNLYRSLDKHLIALIFDVPYMNEHHGGVTVPFLGGNIYIPTGVYRIAKNTKSLVAPFYVRDLGVGEVAVEFSTLLEPQHYNKEEFMRLLVAQLEYYIQLKPSRWWLWEALPLMRR